MHSVSADTSAAAAAGVAVLLDPPCARYGDYLVLAFRDNAHPQTDLGGPVGDDPGELFEMVGVVAPDQIESQADHVVALIDQVLSNIDTGAGILGASFASSPVIYIDDGPGSSAHMWAHLIHRRRRGLFRAFHAVKISFAKWTRVGPDSSGLAFDYDLEDPFGPGRPVMSIQQRYEAERRCLRFVVKQLARRGTSDFCARIVHIMPSD